MPVLPATVLLDRISVAATDPSFRNRLDCRDPELAGLLAVGHVSLEWWRRPDSIAGPTIVTVEPFAVAQ